MSFAEVKIDKIDANGGFPQLCIDGQKTVPLLYALSDIPAAAPWNDCSQRGIKNFANCGINIVCIDSNLHEGWQENGEYNPESLYSDISAVLMSNPNAKIITRLHLNPPYWWLRKYPEEQIKYYQKRENNGLQEWVEVENTDHGGYGDRTIARKFPVEVRASYASEQWLKDCADIIDQLCNKLKAHPLGEYVIGIQLAYGTCGEWHYWAGYSADRGLTDFSLPMQHLFRKIVRERYKTEEELKKFYGEDATFENVEMATPQQCSAYFNEIPSFLPPEKYARVIDTVRLYSVSAANAICYLSKRIKDSWGAGMLVGAFYGYYFWSTSARGSHVETQKILSDANVDFLAAPCAYSVNKRPGNMNLLRYVAESCRLNGTLMLCEMDQGYESWCNSAVYSCESEEEYSSLVKRNIMENILLGHGAWYYDHRLPTVSVYQKQEYWTQPERLATIAEIQRACEKLQDKPYKKTTDVLLVVDHETRYYIRHDDCPLPFINAIGKCGTGFDRLFLTDIERCNLSRYKCVMFVNCRIMSQGTFDYIKNQVMADGRTVVFVNDFAKVIDKNSVENGLEQILGEPVDADYAEYDLPDCRAYRIVEEKEYVDGNTWVVDREIYRKIFEKSGAHIYTDNGEVVIADNEMVMVHCKDTPQTVLHLHCGDVKIQNEKYSTVVYNTFTGEKIL